MTDCQNNEIHVPSWWQFGLVLMFGVVLVSIVYGLGQLSKRSVAGSFFSRLDQPLDALSGVLGCGESRGHVIRIQ